MCVHIQYIYSIWYSTQYLTYTFGFSLNVAHREALTFSIVNWDPDARNPAKRDHCWSPDKATNQKIAQELHKDFSLRWLLSGGNLKSECWTWTGLFLNLRNFVLRVFVRMQRTMHQGPIEAASCIYLQSAASLQAYETVCPGVEHCRHKNCSSFMFSLPAFPSANTVVRIMWVDSLSVWRLNTLWATQPGGKQL